MSGNNPFQVADEHISWAEEAIAELNLTARDFFGGESTKLVCDFNDITGEWVASIKLVKPFPSAFGRKTTEALVGTRHSFDQAVNAANAILCGPSNKDIHFPWAMTPTDFHRRCKEKGIHQNIADAIFRHEPFPAADTHSGGNTAMRSLTILANKKHTIGFAVNGHVHHMKWPRVVGTGPGEKLTIPTPWWNPVTQEVVVARWIGGTVDITNDYEMALEILFSDTSLPQPMNVLYALKEFTAYAKVIVKDLKAVTGF